MSDNEESKDGKIRDLLPGLKGLINHLVDGSKDVSSLELSNNLRAIRRAKAHMREHEKLVDDYKKVLDKVRLEILGSGDEKEE